MTRMTSARRGADSATNAAPAMDSANPRNVTLFAVTPSAARRRATGAIPPRAPSAIPPGMTPWLPLKPRPRLDFVYAGCRGPCGSIGQSPPSPERASSSHYPTIHERTEPAVVELGEARAVEGAAHLATDPLGPDDPRAREAAEVPGHERLAEVQADGELRDAVRALGREDADDQQTGIVREGAVKELELAKAGRRHWRSPRSIYERLYVPWRDVECSGPGLVPLCFPVSGPSAEGTPDTDAEVTVPAPQDRNGCLGRPSRRSGAGST